LEELISHEEKSALRRRQGETGVRATNKQTIYRQNQQNSAAIRLIQPSDVDILDGNDLVVEETSYNDQYALFSEAIQVKKSPLHGLGVFTIKRV